MGRYPHDIYRLNMHHNWNQNIMRILKSSTPAKKLVFTKNFYTFMITKIIQDSPITG